MQTKKIREFVIGDRVDAFFAVRKKVVREYTRGQFVSLELGDATGRINAVLWEPDQFALAELDDGMVVKIRGVVGEYQNKSQLTVEKIRLALENEYTLEDILPHSTQSYEERKARLMTLTDKIENSYVLSLVKSFWEDEKFLDDYLKAAAGKLWHHAYIGGLSEHSANVAELALKVATGYDFLDKDLLIFGGLFHDAGKVGSYSTTGNMIDYTDEGRLVGHISLVDQWTCARAAKIEAFPEKLLVKLRHMLLSHHGELQYAS
ncbi:MAG: 3'-5' exoribonuclease YhaM family protein, partial [Candidatus Zixiibacteriota bacterium]